MSRLQFLLDHRFARSRLSAYVDGDLDTMERRRVGRHIDECPDCDGVARALRGMLGVLALLRYRPGSPLAADVRARLPARWRSGRDARTGD